MHRLILALAFSVPLAGCGTSTPSADMPLRDAKYYEANAAERSSMQKICDQWKGSTIPPAAFPSIIVSNCKALVEIKELAKRQAALRYYRGGK